MNEYAVNSFRDAINVSLIKLGYDTNNREIVKKLIINALEGKSNYFTRTNGARKYVEDQKFNNGILREMIASTKIASASAEDIIDKYIDTMFVDNKKTDVRQLIKENHNFEKINQKIRYINTSSISDQDFVNKVWTSISNIFMGRDKNISVEEIRYDILEAALKKAEQSRDNATILKDISLYSKNLTVMDAVKLVDEYVSNNNLNDLLVAINHNQVLSGLLIQNLLDYVHFKKKGNSNVTLLYEIDKLIENKEDIQGNISLIEKMIYEETSKKNKSDLDKNDILIGLLTNSLALNFYSTNKNFIDHDERKLYCGTRLDNEEIFQKRMEKNNIVSNNIMLNGVNTTVEEVANYINNLSEDDIKTLISMFAISRSTNENIEKIDNSLYYANRDQIHILNILESVELKEELNKKIEKTA